MSERTAGGGQAAAGSGRGTGRAVGGSQRAASEARRDTATIRTYRELAVSQKAFEQAMRIFELTKRFPKEEQYSLTDQLRRASRSVRTNVDESWRKRRYPAHVVSKLSDADAEVTETMIWLDFALHCRYLMPSTSRSVRCWGPRSRPPRSSATTSAGPPRERLSVASSFLYFRALCQLLAACCSLR